MCMCVYVQANESIRTHVMTVMTVSAYMCVFTVIVSHTYVNGLHGDACMYVCIRVCAGVL